MSTRKCNMCESQMVLKTIATTVPGTKPVQLSKCRQCDVRRCGNSIPDGKCEVLVQNPFARRCSAGHDLTKAFR